MIGNVVGFLYDQYKLKDDNKSFINYFVAHRKNINEQDQIFNIGRKNVIKNPNKKSSLLFTVNDILLDLSDSIQEFLSKTAFSGRVNHENMPSWAKIKSQNDYHRLWFDDNIGGFLVNIAIKKNNIENSIF